MTPLDPVAIRLAGRVLIEASAGTGKTYTIATLYVRLLLERALDVASILVVTYTRAATSELRERIRARLSLALAVLDGQGQDEELGRFFDSRRDASTRARDRALLAAALRDFDQAAIFTIHAFCQRVLTEHALQTELPFALQLAEHDTALLDDIAADYFAQLTFSTPRGLVAALRADGVDPETLGKLARQTVRDDGTHILPTPEPPPYDPALERRFVEARERVAELWERHRESLVPVWRDSRALNRISYKSIMKWALVLDSARVQAPAAFAFARRLTPAGLVVKKDATFDASNPFYAAMQPLAEAVEALTENTDGAVVRARRQLVDYARVALARQHAERGELGFDDLLQALARALQGPGGPALARTLAERLPVALIDEFQDTDPVQYGIFSRIYERDDTCLCLIGDPKQAIYGFRGADVLAYVKAARDAGAARHTLAVNWRSDPSMVAALNALYAGAPRPFLLDDIDFVRVAAEPRAVDHLRGDRDHALQVLWLSSAAVGAEGDEGLAGGLANEALPGLVAGEITALLHGDSRIEERVDGGLRTRPVLPSDIAVLCRTNKQARATQVALAALSVPTVLDGDRSVFESDMAGHLARVLAAVAAPTDGRRLAAALLGPVLGVSPEALVDMVQRDDAFEPWLERLARWSELWRERGFVRMFQALVDEARVQENVLREPGGERLLTDLLHLGELLHETSGRERLGPEALLGWFWQRRHDPRDAYAEESAQLRLEHDERALRLTTVHRSKGLEYPIVYCPFSWGAPRSRSYARFHDAAADDAPTFDLGSNVLGDHLKLALREDAAEDARLLYVALTRARHRTYLVSGRFKDAGSALACLLHQRAAAIEPPEVKKRLKKISEADQLDELRALAEASGGVIGVRSIGHGEAAPYRRPAGAAAKLSALDATRPLHPVARATSFSRLVAAQAALDAAVEGDEHDVDAQVADAPVSVDVADALPLLAPAKVVLHDFPAGPGPGTLIHAIYEHLDFPAADLAAVRAVAEPRVAGFGLQASVRLDALAEGILQTLDAPLDPEGTLRLREVAAADRLDELEFTLCTQRAERMLSPRALASALERTDALPERRDYYARLAALPGAFAAEHLKGFVDLVFRRDGRYYVADYKSNKLGEHAADYERDAVLEAMSEHHYFLQGYLYALALHRHLSRRLAGYDFERCFGGVAYLFVRGMAPSHSPGSSVWLHRPSLASLEALGEALGEGARAP